MDPTLTSNWGDLTGLAPIDNSATYFPLDTGNVSGSTDTSSNSGTSVLDSIFSTANHALDLYSQWQRNQAVVTAASNRPGYGYIRNASGQAVMVRLDANGNPVPPSVSNATNMLSSPIALAAGALVLYMVLSKK